MMEFTEERARRHWPSGDESKSPGRLGWPGDLPFIFLIHPSSSRSATVVSNALG
jgi:hypothetical protein